MATQSVRIGWRPYVNLATTTTYLLDSYSGAIAAYSLRKLKVSYSGYAIRVRRSSDNTEQNIGFNASNDLDTTALTAFVGSGSGFITTWYDQSGNGVNVFSAVNPSSPTQKIISLGTINTLFGLPL